MSLYNFKDLDDTAYGEQLPSEALSINGVYLEQVIPGYRTLGVSGREILPKEAVTVDIGTADGSYIQRTRTQSRTITVEYQLIARSASEFRAAYNKLNEYLNVTEAEIVFGDEPDKYYIGSLTDVGDVPRGRLNVTSTFDFLCADPYKYTLQEYEAEVTSETLEIVYQGTAKTYPVVEITMTSDNGYVSVINENGAMVQIGDSEESDTETNEVSETLFYDQFVTDISSLGTDWIYDGSQDLDPSGFGAGEATGSTWTFGTFGGVKCIRPNSYGTRPSGASWWGGQIWKILPNDSTDVYGAQNWKCNFRSHCILGAVAQGGAHVLSVGDTNGDNIASIAVMKSWANNSNAYVAYYVLGQNVYTYETQLADNSSNPFGYSNGSSYIQVNGDKITFYTNKTKWSYTNADLENHEAGYISWHPARYGSSLTPFSANLLRSVKFVKNYTSVTDITNFFSEGDVVRIDFATGSIKVNDIERPDLYALGNSWFKLHEGMNEISVGYSAWATQPSIKIYYREAYR